MRGDDLGRDLRGSGIDVVAGDSDVVGGRAPAEPGGAAAERHVEPRRLAWRSAIATRAIRRRDRHCRHVGAVAGQVERYDSVAVRVPAADDEHVRRGGLGGHLGAARVHVVADHGRVVGRVLPRQRRRRRGQRHLQVAGDRWAAWCRPPGSRRWSPSRSPGPERFPAASNATTPKDVVAATGHVEHVLRRGVLGADLDPVRVHVVAGHAGVVGRRIPGHRRRTAVDRNAPETPASRAA